MAIRPIFIPVLDGPPFVREVEIEFKWHPGFSKAQMQKSIESLHCATAQKEISPILDISSKSPYPLGVSLSAFNLRIELDSQEITTVECAYQGSKVFEEGGPYQDLYLTSSREAKQDPRIRTSGEVIRFDFQGQDFSTFPIHGFYDWLYIYALWQKINLEERILEQILEFKGFSDIAFNPKRSFNCQARSVALFVSLHQNNLIKSVVEDRYADYLDLITDKTKSQLSQPNQLTLFEMPEIEVRPEEKTHDYRSSAKPS